MHISLPGGTLTAAQLAALASAAAEFGSAVLELTGHGSLVIPGIDSSATATVGAAMAQAGLLRATPAGIVASPLSGRVGALPDVRAWVTGLHAMMRTEPALTQLPEGFLFSVDDGRGDVSALGADVGAHAIGDHAALVLAGCDTGVRLTGGDIVEAVIAVAVRFTETRGSASRVSALADPSGLWPGAELGGGFRHAARSPVGWIEQDDGRVALGAAVPRGLLSARVAEFLAAIQAPLVVTPWHSILVCDLDEGVADTALRVLAPMGLVFDADSPWADR